MANEASVGNFRAALRGELLRPGDAGYEEARRVYNGMIDRRPALIARCRDAADVVASVRFAGESGMRTAIRGGGHNAGGLGVCDDGLVIDLSRMRGIRVDPEARTARVEGGCTWGDVDHATHPFGFAVPSGIISSTGVGGLTLGGGIGHLTRKYGLTIDSLVSADVVLADGRLVTADEKTHPDLFWAIRGGGGNFGVVTSFLFRMHPVDTVQAGPMLWNISEGADLLRFYREFLPGAPEDITGFFGFLVVPPAPHFPAHLHGKTMCGIVWCHTGPPERLEDVLRPVRRFTPPALDLVAPMPFPVLQGMFDAMYTPGLRWYWKADFFGELSDEAVERHVEHGARVPTVQSTMHLYPVDGAAHRMGRNDTAWSYRDARWAEVIVGVDPDPANDDRIIGWARNYWEATHPCAVGGAYVNFMMDDEGQERIRASYRDNYDRLVAVKDRYDPGNLFRVNQNIRPSAEGGKRSAA